MNNKIPPPEQQTQPESHCFEDSLSELEQIVQQLEEGELGLAEALAKYEAGVKHLRQCFQFLEQAERKIELLTGVAEDGTAQTEPFDGEATVAERTPRGRGG